MSSLLCLLLALDAILVVLMVLRITYGFPRQHAIVVPLSHVPFCRAIQMMVQLQSMFSAHIYFGLQFPLQLVMHLVDKCYQRVIQYVNLHATMLSDMYR